MFGKFKKNEEKNTFECYKIYAYFTKISLH